MSGSYTAECGCRVSVLHDFRGDVSTVRINHPCGLHSQPAPGEQGGGDLMAIIADISTMRAKITALEAQASHGDGGGEEE